MTAMGAVNVLIVDDNAAQRMSLAAVLADLDVGIREAASGREALRQLLEQEFALILLDVNMPGLDGFETAALIRSRHVTERTPIIFITAHGDDAHAARGYSLRAVDYILAPVQPEVLRTKVSVLIELYRATKEVTQQREALRRYANQLQQLSRASLAINATQSIEDVLRTMSVSAVEIIGARAAATVAALADGTRTIKVTHEPDAGGDARDGDVTRAHTAVTSDLQPPMRIGDGETPSTGAPAALPQPGIRDALAAPLHGSDGRGFGMIRLSDKWDGTFTAEDEDILTQLTQMASIAMGNILSREARESNRLKDEFLSVLSHELRTPLQAMLTWLSIMRHKNADAQTMAHGLEVVERSARAQAQLIEDLLDVSRIIRGKMRIEQGVVDLVRVIGLALETLAPAAAAKAVRIDFERPPGECRIMGDAARLQQVVWNLVSNAIKFTPKDGRVEVRLDTEDAPVHLHVTDTGPGIPADFLPYVFERFRQADGSVAREHGGLGLGLAIVRHLVELHGGGVQVANNAGGCGARFTVWLPRAELPAESQPAMASRPLDGAAANSSRNGISLDGIHVMLVEDEIAARESLATALQLYGAEVVAVDSMVAALRAIEQRRPDVLLSDIGMPGGDGYALIQRVRARETPQSGRVPAAALTAYVRPEDRSAALRAGFDTHLSKPVDPLELARVVKWLVETGERPRVQP